MATAATGSIIRIPGRLILTPTNLTVGGSPYGGTMLGTVRGIRFNPHPKYRDIWAEESGTVVDSFYVGEGPCELRGIVRYPDNDMISTVAARSILGANRHWLFRPLGTTGNTRAGTSLFSTAVKLLFAPKADGNHPAILMYNAIGQISEDLDLRMSLSEEYGLSVRFVGTPDTSGRVYDTGRMADLTL